MPRLKEPPARVARLPSRIARQSDDAGHNPTAEPWRKWYKLTAWRRLRWATLVRDRFTCQRCHRLEPNSSQLVADHRVPHRGDQVLFWKPDNLQTLCAGCHSSAKQREEARARKG